MTIDANEQNSAADRWEGPLSARPGGPVAFRRVGTLSSAKRDPATSETTYYIKTSGADLLEFGEKEYFLWRLFDGTNSADGINGKFTDRFGSPLTAEQFDRFVDQLVACGALERQMPIEAALPKPSETPIVPPPPETPKPELPAIVPRRRTSLALFDPTALLHLLDWLCGPTRFFRWLLLPALVAVPLWFLLDPSGLSAFAGVDLRAAVAIGVVALLVVGIVPPLAQAVTASFLGYDTPACYISFRGGVIPRLTLDDTGWQRMLPRHVLPVMAAPSLARLTLFAGGASLWLASRGSGDLVPTLALAIGVLSLASFFIGVAPFLPTQGRRWLAAVCGGIDPWSAESGCRGHAAMLSLLWLATAGGILAVAAAVALQAAHPAWFDPSIGKLTISTAVPLLAAAPVVLRLWLKTLVDGDGGLQPAYAYAGDETQAFAPSQRFDRSLRQSRMVVETPVGPGRRQARERWASTSTIVVWATIFGVTIAFAFIAYPYEAGGYFTILPYDSSQLNARVQRPGAELTEVLVNEGDEVHPGQILGILSDWQQKSSLDTAKAQLQNAEANLAHLLETPRPVDVELARQQYEAAMARLPYDKAQFERYAALVTNDNVSRSNYEQVLSQYQQDQAAAEVARANYDQIREPPTQAQIDAARAQVRLYTATVAFDEDELERTRIRATSYGKVVTPNPMLLRGKWFDAGAVVFTVEDERMVQADVQVPETDVDNVRLGGPVRLRFWGTPERTVVGKSTAIAPDAQAPKSANPQAVQSGTANVIRVRVEVPNPNGLLHPNTDGYAKLSGYDMPAWRAFGQMLERFFLVEIWSWIP